MDLGLENRVALVTGASGGIGAVIATTLAAEGARVGVAAPTNEMITRQVLRVERGEIPPRPENVLINS